MVERSSLTVLEDTLLTKRRYAIFIGLVIASALTVRAQILPPSPQMPDARPGQHIVLRLKTVPTGDARVTISRAAVNAQGETATPPAGVSAHPEENKTGETASRKDDEEAEASTPQALTIKKLADLAAVSNLTSFKERVLAGGAVATVEIDATPNDIYRWGFKEYNEERPHGSLGYRTPKEFAAAQAAGFCRTELGQGDSNAVPLPQAPSPLKPEMGLT